MDLLFYLDILVSAFSLIVPLRNFLAIKRRNGTFSIHFQFRFYLPSEYFVNVKMSKRVHSLDQQEEVFCHYKCL